MANPKSNFEVFRKNCETAPSFGCQIFLKNNLLVLIKNDFSALKSVDEVQIFYFKGIYQERTAYKRSYSYRTAETDNRHNGGSFWWGGSNPICFSWHFEDNILYRLAEHGLGLDIVDSLIPILYENYSADEDWRYEKEEIYQKFKERWKGRTKICRRAYWLRMVGLREIVLKRKLADDGSIDTRFDDDAVIQFMAFYKAVEAILQEEGRVTWDSEIFTTHLDCDMDYILTPEFGEKEKSFMLCVRATDTKPNDAYVDYAKNWWKQENQEKKFSDISRSGIRHFDVIINDKTFNSYEEALETIKAVLKDPKKWIGRL